MSIRIALEQHIKNRLDESLAGSKYEVVESLRNKERPVPSVVIVAGMATPCFNLSDITGNYTIPVSVVILSSIDKTSIDEHNNVVQTVIEKMRQHDTRRVSTIKNLHIYQIDSQAIAQDNSDRKMGVSIEYNCTVNYSTEG
jgi:hypothetical protein